MTTPVPPKPARTRRAATLSAETVAVNGGPSAGADDARGDNTRADNTHAVERMIAMMSLLPRAPATMSTARVQEGLKALGYHVHIRTVVRDLNKLSQRFGFERRGEQEAGGRRTAPAYAWTWPVKSTGLGSPAMTDTEALAFTMMHEHLGALLPPLVTDALAAQFERAEERLKKSADMTGGGLRQWSRSVRVVQPTQPLQRPPVKHTVRDAICLSLAGRTQFTGWYRGRAATEARELLFNPLGLVIRGEVTYLVASTWTYDDVRLYPLHRFERVRREDSTRREPPGFSLDAWLAAQNGLGFATGRGDVALRLRFRNGVGLHLLETPLSTDQQARDLGDGAMEITGTVPDTGQLHWWLLGFGDNVEVLAPAELREEMKAVAERMVAQYR